jgi:hypothetical protein
MNTTLGLRVEALFAELDAIPNRSIDESQTRRSEILQEVLQLVAISLGQGNHTASAQLKTAGGFEPKTSPGPIPPRTPMRS